MLSVFKCFGDTLKTNWHRFKNNQISFSSKVEMLAAIILPFFTVLWVALATAGGLVLIVLLSKVLRSSRADVDQVTKAPE